MSEKKISRHAYDLMTNEEVIEVYKRAIQRGNEAMKYKLSKYNLDMPIAFNGLNIPDIERARTWVKNHPVLCKVAVEDKKNHTVIIERPASVAEKQWKAFNQFVICGTLLRVKQHGLDLLNKVKQYKGIKALTIDVYYQDPYRLYNLDPGLLKAWEQVALKLEQLKKLNEHENEAYQKLWRAYQKNQTKNKIKSVHVKKQQNSKENDISKQLDSDPFQFPLSHLARSASPSYLAKQSNTK